MTVGQCLTKIGTWLTKSELQLYIISGELFTKQRLKWICGNRFDRKGNFLVTKTWFRKKGKCNKMVDHISILSKQNGDIVWYLSFAALCHYCAVECLVGIEGSYSNMLLHYCGRLYWVLNFTGTDFEGTGHGTQSYLL